MFSVADSNAIRLLSLITETFIETLQPTPGLEPKSITEKSRKLWDSLSAVWVVAVLNPYLLSEDKDGIREKLTLWNDSLQNCQFTDGDETEHAGVINVFQLSLQALAWTVEDAEGRSFLFCNKFIRPQRDGPRDYNSPRFPPFFHSFVMGLAK